MNEAESNSSERCCSYCLLPPKVGKKLKRCSRCHRAWYHDGECQRRHFPTHKIDCKRWSAEITINGSIGNKSRVLLSDSSSSSTVSPPNKKLCVKERRGRGKCLVVTSGNSIKKGEKIRDYKSKRDFWQPLILPVLHEEHRTSRCALCFRRLPQQPTSICSFDLAPKNSLYRLLFCSTSCRVVSSRHGLEQEEQDCYSFLKRIDGHGQKPPSIFSTAIVLYRILTHEYRQQSGHAQIRDQVHALQSKPSRETSNVDNNRDAEGYDNYHTQGVIAVAMGMLQCSKMSLPSQYRPSTEYLVDMVNRIKLNGFSIFYDDDFETCGLGLYGTPSYMNHSCRANALQTFMFQPASPPSLYVTAFRGISTNQEICISYIDTSCPSHMRRQRLEKDYHFFCTCDVCDNNSDLQDDSKTMAIRCLNCCNKPSPSTPSCSSVIRAERGMAPSRPVYKCMECNTMNFDSTLEKLLAFEKKISKDRFLGVTSWKDLRSTYQNLLKICYESSWYVQEAGDRLLQEYLDQLPMLVNDPAQEQKTAWTALKLAEELLGNTKSPSKGPSHTIAFVSTSSFLRYQHLRHKIAKLRLFLLPDPRQAIQELQDVLSSLQPYFSGDHAVIVGLKASLASAMM